MPRGKKYSEPELSFCAEYLEKAVSANARGFTRSEWEAMAEKVHQQLVPILGEANIQRRLWDNLRKRMLNIGKMDKVDGEDGNSPLQRIRRAVQNLQDEAGDGDAESILDDSMRSAAESSAVVANEADVAITDLASASVRDSHVHINAPQSSSPHTGSSSSQLSRKRKAPATEHAGLGSPKRRMDQVQEILLAQIQQREAERLAQQLESAEKLKILESKEKLMAMEEAKHRREMDERANRFEMLLTTLVGKSQDSSALEMREEIKSLKLEIHELSGKVNETCEKLGELTSGFQTLATDITTLVRALVQQGGEGLSK